MSGGNPVRTTGALERAAVAAAIAELRAAKAAFNRLPTPEEFLARLDAPPEQCAEEGCSSTRLLTSGRCRKHRPYLKTQPTQDMEQGSDRKIQRSVCSVETCPGPTKARGFCARHYQRWTKYGDALSTKLHDVNLSGLRLCRCCGIDISALRSNAVFCSRTCKTKASDKRRIVDGRERTRNLARYSKESKQRRAQARSLYWLTHERQLENSRRWRRENPDKRYAMHTNRRARMFGNPGYVDVTAAEWEKALRRNEFRCTYCGSRPEKLVMEHIVPLSRGGRHAPGNVTPACRTCNDSKNAMFIIEWKLSGRAPLGPSVNNSPHTLPTHSV